MFIDISGAMFHQSMKKKTQREVVNRDKVINFGNSRMYIYIDTAGVYFWKLVRDNCFLSFFITTEM